VLYFNTSQYFTLKCQQC